MRNPDSFKYWWGMAESELSDGFLDCEDNFGKLPSVYAEKMEEAHL